MKRRNFIKISSVSLAALLVDGCASHSNYSIEFRNDMSVGHLVIGSDQFPITKSLNTDVMIVGGGIAGMTAAYQLKDRDFLLFELSDVLGGSSSGGRYKNTPLCHGAHYDLSYPSNYGRDVLRMLEELDIIQYDTFTDSWKFVDKQYLISKNRESRTFAHDEFRKDVLPDEPEKADFIALMQTFTGTMPMPTRLIDETHRYLNDVSFLEWLKGKITVSEQFIEGLDYHMKDDFGAGSASVSALAGIHYFACRPYGVKPVELFSPPEGNSYFINKIHEKLPSDRIITSSLVKLIKEIGEGFEVEVIDVHKKEITLVSCRKIIYAGQKHALKYIFPKEFPLFLKNSYAPWVVVNVVLKNALENEAFWQNEILSDDPSLLGFVDSSAQYSPEKGSQVLTVYYCFKPEEREMMSLIETRKEIFIDQTVDRLEHYFDKSLINRIEKIYITQMGHAMPIPIPGYLFVDANDFRSNPNLMFAGVDNGRLPLLFEALDSGIVAVQGWG